MKKKRSETVQTELRNTLAVLARHAAKYAVARVNNGDMMGADNAMDWAEVWLTKAGARAARHRYWAP